MFIIHVFIILRNYSCKILLYPMIIQGTTTLFKLHLLCVITRWILYYLDYT